MVRNFLRTQSDSELMKHYSLDIAVIMFVVDLARDMLTSLTQRNPEIKVITTLEIAYLVTVEKFL